MNWLLNGIILVLAIVLIVLIIVRVRISKRLKSIDGVVGITTHGAYNGRVIGGEFTKIYHRKNKKITPEEK